MDILSSKIDVTSRTLDEYEDLTQFVSESVLFVSIALPFILKVLSSPRV